MAWLQFGGELFDGVGLDHVSDLKLVEAVDADAAFHAGANLVDLVLKTAQRQRVPFEDEVFAAHDPDLALEDASVADDTTGDMAAFGKLEEFLDLGGADDHLLDHRIEQTGHRFLHLVDQFVDDGIKLDLHRFALGDFRHAIVDASVEAENNTLRGRGQEDVGLRDRAHRAVDDFQRDFFRVDLLEGLDDGFDGTLRVRLDDQPEDLGGRFRQRVE